MTFTIRHASAADFDATEHIENAADSILVDLLSPDTWHAAPTGAERALSSGFTLMGFVESAEPVGFVQVLEIDDLAHLEQLSVLPEYARRGFGRQLVAAALAEARRRGHTQLTLRTFADVPWNAPFYESCGFIECEPSTDFHRRLVSVERDLGLTALGRRIQMCARL